MKYGVGKVVYRKVLLLSMENYDMNLTLKVKNSVNGCKGDKEVIKSAYLIRFQIEEGLI